MSVSDSFVQIGDLTKRFSRVVAVDNVSLNIDKGAFVVLLGPSGCGKTTLLRCVAGLESPDEGEIRIGEKIVYSSAAGIVLPPGKRSIDMVFQSYALWPHMTTFDNIADPDVVIYEAYLGAKLHDITDESKLSVMPGEVIGAALGRMMHYENKDGRLHRILKEDIPVKRPTTWGADRTGIAFIDPGFTNVFNVDIKRNILVEKFNQFKEPMKKVLMPDTFATIQKSHSRLADMPAGDTDPFEFLGVARRLWIDILYQSIAYLLSKQDTETIKLCLNYLYTAAFLEFCREKIMQLGAVTFGDVRRMQTSLGVPPEKAQEFYHHEVDRAVEKMALEFYDGRRKILRYLESR